MEFRGTARIYELADRW